MDEKKFSFPEALLMLLTVLFADLFEGLISIVGVVPFLTLVTVGISFLINLFVWAGIQFWLIMKGERGSWFLAGSILEFIPFINILPLRTVTCAISIYLANHPKASSLASTKIGPKIKKAAPIQK